MMMKEAPLQWDRGDSGSESGFNGTQILIIAGAAFVSAALLAVIARKRRKTAEE